MAASADFEKIPVKSDIIACISDKIKYAVFKRWSKYYLANIQRYK